MAMTTAATTLKPSQTGVTDNGEGKFDLSKVNVDSLPEAIREQVKGFQADYTKKTQAIKDKEKEMADKIERGTQWDNWYDRNKDSLNKFNEYAQNIANGGNGNLHKDNRSTTPVVDDDDEDELNLDTGGKKVSKDIGALRQDFETGKKELKNEIAIGQEVLLELMEEIQVGDYPFKINPKKVIDYAKKEGIGQVKRAIQGAYKEELIEHEVNTRVEAKLAVEKEKNIKVVNDSLPQGRVVRRVVKRGDTK
jgi:hypothetical protein